MSTGAFSAIIWCMHPMYRGGVVSTHTSLLERVKSEQAPLVEIIYRSKSPAVLSLTSTDVFMLTACLHLSYGPTAKKLSSLTHFYVNQNKCHQASSFLHPIHS